MSGAAILQALMRVWPTDRLSVADRGLREGLLYAQMSADGVLEDGPVLSGARRRAGRGQRELKVKVKTARGRKLSSTRWLERQLNDPYVRRAKAEGYRGRAAFKIIELDDRFRFLRAGRAGRRSRLRAGRLVPGGGRAGQCAGRRQGRPQGRVLGVDLQEVEPVPGAEIHQLDFLDGRRRRAGEGMARRARPTW